MPALDNGTHRLRLTYDLFPKSVVFSIDFNYAGGAFVNDFSSPTLPMLALLGADGWPFDPARIYFGGDDGTLFKDFQVTVTGPAVRFGDLNSDGKIDSLDWVIFRTNQETDLSGLTLEQAYLRGDLTEDRANNHADFVVFKNLYEAANGAGSFVAMLAGVPEPSTLVLILSAGLFVLPGMRRATNRRATLTRFQSPPPSNELSTDFAEHLDESYELAEKVSGEPRGRRIVGTVRRTKRPILTRIWSPTPALKTSMSAPRAVT